MLLMFRRIDDQVNNNWRRLWEANRKSHVQAARAWLQWLSSSPLSPRALSIPNSTSSSPEAVVMTSISMNQSQKRSIPSLVLRHGEKARGTSKIDKELQDQAERLGLENDQLRA